MEICPYIYIYCFYINVCQKKVVFVLWKIAYIVETNYWYARISKKVVQGNKSFQDTSNYKHTPLSKRVARNNLAFLMKMNYGHKHSITMGLKLEYFFNTLSINKYVVFNLQLLKFLLAFN